MRHLPFLVFEEGDLRVHDLEEKLGLGLEAVARRMGISPRTLQRKLKKEGTSHQDLLDEMRRDLSKRYLKEPGMAICEVASLLGFSEPSAFHRAFRRWTGSTPKEYRQQQA